MWATLLFYPADVAKIRLQAEADAGEHEQHGHRQEAESSPLAAATSEPPTTTGAGTGHKAAGGGGGGGGGSGGPKSFLGQILVVLKRPDLWYAGLGESFFPCPVDSKHEVWYIATSPPL